MVRTVSLESFSASGILVRSEDMIVILATSMAMSLPPPMAMLRSACARAALSLMPSPTIATFLPFFCKLPMKAAFSCGKTPAL